MSKKLSPQDFTKLSVQDKWEINKQLGTKAMKVISEMSNAEQPICQQGHNQNEWYCVNGVHFKKTK